MGLVPPAFAAVTAQVRVNGSHEREGSLIRKLRYNKRMPANREQLEQAIAAQEKLRGIIDDAIIDAAIAAIRHELGVAEEEDTTLIPRQRKLITVLFTDIVNSTRFVQGLDPEDVNILMDTALKRLASVIPKHGGQPGMFG
ncbi:MAG TPA: hypothetical protein VI451_11645 [Anaerolineales bacterium]|nr:hypothetical protein [Anaerolineales bacterium]